MSQNDTAFQPHSHDHAACVHDTLEKAEAICKEQDLRLTPLRKRVLKAIAGSHNAIGAYEIMDLLSEGEKRPAPITVYRVLDFLTENGMVHRLSSLNAFVACAHPAAHHEPYFLICETCGAIGELAADKIDNAIQSEAEARGFVPTQATIEVLGKCPSCK